MRFLLILLPILFYLSGCDSNLKVKTSGSICSVTDPNCLDKQIEGAFNFVILNKESYSNDRKPEIAWEAKANTKSYILMIAGNAECKDPIFSFEDLGQSKEVSFLKDGIYYFCVFAVQEDGRKIAADNNGLKVTYDREKPIITVNNLMTRNLAFQTDATVQDDTPTTYLWEKLSGPGEARFSDTLAINPQVEFSVEGLYEISLTATDAAGNVARSVVSVDWDLLAPSLAVPSSLVLTAPTQITPTVGSETITKKWQTVSAPSGGVFTFSDDKIIDPVLSANVDGAYVIKLTIKDQAGNIASATINVIWNALPPTVSINNFVANLANSSAVSVSGNCSEHGRTITLGGSVVGSATCSSGTWAGTLDYSGLADGAITLTADLDDAFGGHAVQAVRNAVKDTVAPTATVSGEPTGTNNTTTMDITVSGVGVVSYQYDIVDSGTACSAATYSSDIAVGAKITENISGMADGNLRLCIRGQDAAGNLQAAASATTATWTKDTTAPIATVSGEPTGTNNTVVMDITVGGAGVLTYQYDVVASGTACSAAVYSSDITVATKITENISGIADGGIRLCVKGKDSAGNLQAAATEATWTKDTTAPTATIAGAPTGVNNTTTLDVTIGGAGVANYQYAIVPAATICAAASYSADVVVGTKITDDFSGLSDGAIRLCVLGKDASGNLQAAASATEVTWTKDTTAPTATISGEPSGTNNAVVMDITIAGADVVSYQYDIVASGTACSSATYSTDVAVGIKITEDISAIADGGVRLCVKGKDALGNLQATATEATWIKVTTASIATISGEPTGTNNATVMNITIGGTGVVSYQYDIVDSGTTCSAATYSADIAVGTKITEDISGMADGTLRLCVRGKDAANNLQAAALATAVTWTKDTTAPTATFSDEPTGTNNATVMNITVGGTGVLTYQYDIVASGTACTAAVYSADITVATKITEDISGIADGGIRLCVKGKDAAGNLQATATEATWTKDTVAPTATISGEPTGTNNTTVMNITIGGTGVVSYQYDIVDSGTACTAATYSADIAVGTKITEDISGMADATLRLCVRGKDAAGNLQAAASATSATWTKDTTAPTATISNAPSSFSNVVVMDITVAGTDVVSYQYDIVASGTACTAAVYSADIAVATKITEDISGIADGGIRLCVKGKDAVGNLQGTATEATWTKDTVAPTASFSGQPTGTNNTTVMDITVAGTGVATYQYDIVLSGTACTAATYSSDIAVATKITENISGMADGGLRLCVRGRDAAGNFQAAASATEATWTKNTAEINVKQAATGYASGATYDFGSVTIGDKSDITFTIENTGIGSLSVTSVTVGGANPDEFRLVQQPASSVAGSGSTTFVVRFNPDLSTARSATITIANSDSDESAYTINLTGTGTSMTEGRAMAYEIDNTANASTLTNYPVLVKVDTRTYIANGWMHATCRDIRFGNQMRTVSYPYWIEEGNCGREDARIWVRVPTITGSQKMSVFLHWGVATTPGSDGDRVFSFFDDFSATAVNSEKWSTSGTVIQSGGKARLSGTTPSALISTNAILAGNFAIEADVYVTAMGASTNAGLKIGQSLDYVQWYAEGAIDIRRVVNGTSNDDGAGTKGMVVGPHRLTFTQTASSVAFDVDGALVATSTHAGTPSAAADNLEISSTAGSSGYDINVNYIAARKLASPEPVVTTSSLKRIIPVSASASTTAGGYAAANLYDYVESTLWAATGSATQWVEFDLGAPHDIKKIRMRVQQASAGATTHRIHTGSAPAPSNNTYSFNQSTATFDWLTFTPGSTLDNVRYIRIETVSTPSTVAWGEIEIFGEPQQVAFVSTATTSANFGGISGADAICRSEGISAGLSGTFKGLVSDTVTYARDHVITDGKVYNTAAQLVASSYADMWDGSLSNAVMYQANGVASGNEVWTGSNSTGTTGFYECWNWTSDDGGYTGVYGSPTSTTDTWMNVSGAACSDARSVYCMSSAADVKVGIKSASASNGSASAAIDGDTNTLWNEGGYTGWVELDLGRNVTISRIRFLPELSFDDRADYSIYMGKTPNPTTLVKFYDDYLFYDEVWHDYEFTPISVRYIRFQISTPNSWSALREVEVYK